VWCLEGQTGAANWSDQTNTLCLSWESRPVTQGRGGGLASRPTVRRKCQRGVGANSSSTSARQRSYRIVGTGWSGHNPGKTHVGAHTIRKPVAGTSGGGEVTAVNKRQMSSIQSSGGVSRGHCLLWYVAGWYGGGITSGSSAQRRWGVFCSSSVCNGVVFQPSVQG